MLLSPVETSPGAVPPSTLIATPSGDGHDYETQESWDESPPHEYYSHYTSDDKVGSSDEDDEDEDDPHYEPVRTLLHCLTAIQLYSLIIYAD